MKKILTSFLFLLTASALVAQEFAFADIDAIMEENALKDASNRYVSVMLYFFPEEATRKGMTQGNKDLNVRTPERTQQALQALDGLRTEADNINKKQLPADKKVDYDLFSRSLNAQRWKWHQNNLANPLYYAGAFDAIYDLYLRTNDNPRQRNGNVFQRAALLSGTLQQATQNLRAPSPFLAQLAMEKAYYAYLSFDEVMQTIAGSVADEFIAKETQAQLAAEKKVIKQLFDLFKKQTQEESTADYRLGADIYDQLLKQVYDINEKSDKLNRELTKNFEETQHALFDALQPFEQTADDLVTVIGEGDELTTEAQPKKANKKDEKPVYVPPTAAQYFAVAAHFEVPQTTENIPALLEQEANDFAFRLSQDYEFPALIKPISVKPLPAYFAYMLPHLFIDADGFNQNFFVRVPSGNKLAKQKMLAEDFNAPMRKVLISRELVPGAYYQAAQTAGLSRERKLYASPTLQNGWKAFALDLAMGNGFFVTDEEMLAAAWTSYRSALSALLDFQLNSRFISYNEALSFLVDDNGFTDDQAKELLREIILNPGQAVSTEVGRDIFVRVYNKYVKKFGKKFTKTDLLKLFFKTGNVPPSELENEIARQYQALKAK